MNTMPSDEELARFAGKEDFLLFCDADDFVDIARAVLTKYSRAPQWIPVSERLPEPNTLVLAWFPNDREPIGLDVVRKSTGDFSMVNGARPTHWMPLPEPPSEGE